MPRPKSRTTRKPSTINPAYYRAAGNLQSINVLEGFNLDLHTGTAVSYLLRAGKKAGEEASKDRRKAIWWLLRKEIIETGELPKISVDAGTKVTVTGVLK